MKTLTAKQNELIKDNLTAYINKAYSLDEFGINPDEL